jgi:hypothetical protein
MTGRKARLLCGNAKIQLAQRSLEMVIKVSVERGFRVGFSVAQPLHWTPVWWMAPARITWQKTVRKSVAS